MQRPTDHRRRPDNRPTECEHGYRCIAIKSKSFTPPPDFQAIKTRRKSAWSSGDYAVVGTVRRGVGAR
jgi:hypothetical protein